MTKIEIRFLVVDPLTIKYQIIKLLPAGGRQVMDENATTPANFELDLAADLFGFFPLNE